MSTETNKINDRKRNSKRNAAFVCLMLGGAGLLIVRGWSSLNRAGVMASAVAYQEVETEFREKWQDKRTELEEENSQISLTMTKLRSSSDSRNTSSSQELSSLSKRQANLREQISEIRLEESTERMKLMKGEWKDLKRESRMAGYRFIRLSYYRQWILVPALFVLAVGLMLLATNGTKSEAFLGLTLIGILAYSLLIGGAVWTDNSFDFMRYGLSIR